MESQRDSIKLSLRFHHTFYFEIIWPIKVYLKVFERYKCIDMLSLLSTVIKPHSFCLNNIAVQNIPAAINTQ